MATQSNALCDLPELIEIRCVHHVANDDPCGRIEAVGGLREGITWMLAQSEAIGAIDRGDARFYVRTGKNSSAVIIDVDENGHRYLKGATDVASPTSLLALPECPRSSLRLRRHFDWSDVESKPSNDDLV